MNVMNIKKGFYTDGMNLFSKECGVVSIWIAQREESEHFLKRGSDVARIGEKDYCTEVKPVKAGMTFLNGEIVVIDKNTIEIQFVKPVNPVYDSRGYCVAHDGYKEWRGLYKS